MTIETQTFIEPKDIKGIRIECSSCHTRTTVPLETEKSRGQAKELLSRFKCQHCPAEWFTVKDSSYLELVAKFFDALAAMQAREDQKMSMLLEIASPMPSASRT